MNFSAIVSNPPYQINDGGAQASARPIYQEFVMIAKSMNPNFFSFITPSRWFAGGKGLDKFRASMLGDCHIKEMHDFLHPEEVFPNTNNRGGVCFFAWDINYDNLKSNVKVVTHDKNDCISESLRPMKVEGLDIFVRSAHAISILEKVQSSTTNWLNEYVSPRRPFGIDSNIVKSDKYKASPSGMKFPVQCIGKGRRMGYIEKMDVASHQEWIDERKIFMPRANNIGTELSDDNLNAFIGEPGTVCTEAYIAVGATKNLSEQQAVNLVKYMRTKFARFMHSIAKASQDATAKTFAFVPVVDFNQEWTDKQLYKRFNLTNEEIVHIEMTIKPME